MKLIHTLLFMAREEYLEQDLVMAGKSFETLSLSEENSVVIYNQGCLNNDQLEDFLKSFNLDYRIIGDGYNIGIPQARQKCFEYVWANYDDVPFISEIHLDMLFPCNWYDALIAYLESNDEPMISPAIITKTGEIFPKGNGRFDLPDKVEDILRLLMQLSENKLIKGFVHPVIHKASILKEVGGYDTGFLKGKQAYEDDSLLLGYLYYMGTRTNWYPKVNFCSVVYHAYMGQRMTLANLQVEHKKNLDGLFRQYGAYGLRCLAEMHILESKTHFEELFSSVKGN